MCLDLAGFSIVYKSNIILKNLMAENKKLVKQIVVHPYDVIMHYAGIRIHAAEEYAFWRLFHMLLSNENKTREQDMIFKRS